MRKPLFLVISALVAGVGLQTASAQRPLVPDAVGAPLADEARRILDALPNEAIPTTDVFYFRSNEWRQDLLRPHLSGLGGAIVGVGSDQLYTMAALAGSSLIVSVDYDARIRLVHKIYGVIVPRCETPAALIEAFSDAQKTATTALLSTQLAGDPDLGEILRQYDRQQHAWWVYLRRVERVQRDGRPISWLGDATMYQHVRDMHRNGRVIARTGDVTATTTLAAVGRALGRLGVKARIVYFSNAEQFFNYTPEFLANMRGLPTDDRSVVVRTIRHRNIRIAQNGRWHYMVHELPDFISRIETGYYPRSFALVSDLLSHGPPFLGRDGISTMTSATRRTLMERQREAEARD